MKRSPFAKQLKRFDSKAPLDRAATLPASWYVDPEALELEKRTVFRSEWLAVGRADQAAEPGAYFSGELLGEPYVVARGLDGKLRAFYNVCRHHAAGIVAGCGKAKRLSCPYHGWTYELDGSLCSAPRAGVMKDFRPGEFGLKSLAVEQWGPLIFIHFGEKPGGLVSGLGELDRRLSAAGFATLGFAERRSYELACNWKVYVDNYLDGGYHVAILHKELTKQLDLKSYQTELFGRYSIQSVKGKGADTRVGAEAIYAWIYPNLMINRYGRMLDVNVVVPLGPDSCRVDFEYFFEETSGEAAKREIEASLPPSDRVQREDVRICESVQRGLRSAAYDVGRYAPDWEKAALHFHRLLAADLR